jgi:hypothetical protein
MGARSRLPGSPPGPRIQVDEVHPDFGSEKGWLAVDDIVEQSRWASRDIMERYDSEQDRRRDKVVNVLASLVDDAKS